MLITNKPTIRSIQYLRGIASCVVVFQHLSDRTVKYNIIAPGLNDFGFGFFGVDLFFIISGFIMIYITKPNQSIFKFWLRRFLRISPIYYVLTIISLVIYIYLPNSGQFKPDIYDLINSILYIPTNRGAIVGVGWSLNYEMYFYFIFGLALFMPAQYQVFAILLFLASSVGLGFIIGINDPFIQQVTSPLLIEFCIGILIGQLFKTGKTFSPRLAFSALGVSIGWIVASVMFGINMDYRVLIFALPCAGLVVSLLSLESKNVFKFDAKLPLLAGEISYSLYLVHIAALAVFGKLVMKFSLFNSINGYALYFFDFMTAFLVAYVVYKTIEQPLHKITEKLTK